MGDVTLKRVETILIRETRQLALYRRLSYHVFENKEAHGALAHQGGAMNAAPEF